MAAQMLYNPSYDPMKELKRITDGFLATPSEGQDNPECEKESITPLAARIVMPEAGPSTLAISEETLEEQDTSQIPCPPAVPISDEIGGLLSSLRKFLTNPIVPKREGPKLAMSTFQSLERLLVAFCEYIQCKEVRPATTDDFLNINCIEEYAQSLHESKKRSFVTVARNIGAIIHMGKYLHSCKYLAAAAKEDDFLKQLRNIQNQYLRLNTQKKKLEREKNPKIYWSEILSILRSTYTRLEQLGSGHCEERSRIYHDFVLLLMFITAVPSRNSEYYKLRILSANDMDKDEEERLDKEYNYIVFSSTETPRMLCFQYKTAAHYGRLEVRLSTPSLLPFHLTKYEEDHRERLLMGKEHDFFFVRKDGDAFQSSAAFTLYLNRFFSTFTSERISTPALRSALVTHVLAATDCDEKLMESLSGILRHTRQTQKRVYDRRSFQEKTRTAANFMTRTALTALELGEGDETAFTGDDKDIPPLQSLVALVEECSTESNPSIFIGKVIAYSEDRRNVQLSELEEIETNCYRLKVGSHWEDNTDALVHPIDIVYNSSTNYYHLHSDKKDIHNLVKKA